MFVVPFTIFMLMNILWWVSALLATVIAVCLSYIFLGRQRHEVAATVESWRHGTNEDADNDLENAALDAIDTPGAPDTSRTSGTPRTTD